jgi:hypothetical protein
LSYKESVRHRDDYGTAPVIAYPCEPVPSRQVFEETIMRLMNEHPDWSQVRVRQRALVEMYKEKI